MSYRTTTSPLDRQGKENVSIYRIYILLFSSLGKISRTARLFPSFCPRENYRLFPSGKGKITRYFPCEGKEILRLFPCEGKEIYRAFPLLHAN